MSKTKVAAGWLSASTLSDSVNRAEPAGDELLVGAKTPADTALQVVKKRLAIHPLVTGERTVINQPLPLAGGSSSLKGFTIQPPVAVTCDAAPASRSGPMGPAAMQHAQAQQARQHHRQAARLWHGSDRDGARGVERAGVQHGACRQLEA